MPVKSISRTWPNVKFEAQTSLCDLNKNTAPSRIDHKFCVPEVLLESFLELLVTENFSVIFFDSKKTTNDYQTKYFDTVAFENFHHHRCGKFLRRKFRWRKYGETADSFLEQKEKRGKKTTKTRFVPNNKDDLATQLQRAFNTNSLQQTIDISYERMTFVSQDFEIKITIDRFLTFQTEQSEAEIMPHFFILEIKVPKTSEQGFSVLKKFLHSYRVRSVSFSKYCIGMCLKYSNLPRNKWKQVFKKYIVE